MKWLQNIMGLKDKVIQQQKTGKPEDTLLTQKEATFIIAKLRQANYQGAEFEQFYQVMTKLQALIEK